MPWGRLLQIRADRWVVSVAGKLCAVAPGAEPAAAGDLVQLGRSDEVLATHANQSQTPLHLQDWWRLHEAADALRERARIIADIRAWFRAAEFLEVETPLAALSPGLEVHLQAVPATVAGQDRFLVTSPEYHMKRLLSAALPRIVSLGPVFRDFEAGEHHHTQFTMLEWYRVDEGPDALMADVEALVALAFGAPRSWTRITVADALARWGTVTDDPDCIVRQLVEVVEPQLAELGAVFLTEYPASLASLARLSPSNPAVSERFEAYVDGVELANGFGELTDPVEQRRRFEADLAARRELGLPIYPIDERFLDALAAGLPPCAGIALGIDRLVMLALGKSHLNQVVTFPPELA